MNESELHEFMAMQRLAVVSSSAPDGSTQSALVGIAVTRRLEIIFDTSKSSRKYRNFSVETRCSLVLGWADERTLQFEGRASFPTDEELLRLQQEYFAAWPDGHARASSPDTALVVVYPQWIRFSDYSKAPPLIAEITFKDGWFRSNSSHNENAVEPMRLHGTGSDKIA